MTSNATQSPDHTAVPPQTCHAHHAAFVATGATGHCLDPAAEPCCTNMPHTDAGPSAQVANGANVETTKRATMPLANELSSTAQEDHIFDDLKSGSLISIGQLCDDDCVALFTKHNVNILKDGKAIIVGNRNAADGLWNMPLAPKAMSPPTIAPSPSLHQANGALHNRRTKQDLAACHHATMYSPKPSTFLRAVQRGHFTSWPGITTSLITKHLAKFCATSLGHLRMQQQNTQHAKITADLPLETSLDFAPSQEPHNARTHSAQARSSQLHFGPQTESFLGLEPKLHGNRKCSKMHTDSSPT